MAAPAFKPPPFGKGPRAVEAAPEKKHRSASRYARTKTVHHVEDDGEGNWLVSYADMMTLLFGFFVMLSAFSVPDAGKMEALKRETAESMGGKYTKPFQELSDSVQKTLADINLAKEVSVVETDDGVTIVSKGTLFFDSGSSELKPEASQLMEKIAGVLAVQAKDFRIFVEGHTDDSPIATREFPSNWELSSIRAGKVVRLLEGKGIPRKNLRPLGLADTEPISPNRDSNGTPIPANQAENRRIVIRVQKQLPKRLNDPASASARAGTTAGKPPAPASTASPAPVNASAPASVPMTAPTSVTPVSAPAAPGAVPAASPAAVPATPAAAAPTGAANP